MARNPKSAPLRIPLGIHQAIKAIVVIYQDQPLARGEIERRLGELTDPEDWQAPSGKALQDALDAINAKLDVIQADAKAAALKGTRQPKARTTRKSDK